MDACALIIFLYDYLLSVLRNKRIKKLIERERLKTKKKKKTKQGKFLTIEEQRKSFHTRIFLSNDVDDGDDDWRLPLIDFCFVYLSLYLSFFFSFPKIL